MIAARMERIGPWTAAIAFTLGFVLFGLAGLYTFRQQLYVNQELCKSAVENRDAIRATWNAAYRLVLEGQTTKEDRDRTTKFFDGILREIPPLECVDSEPQVKEG